MIRIHLFSSWYILIPLNIKLMAVLREKLNGPFASLVQLWTSQTYEKIQLCNLGLDSKRP